MKLEFISIVLVISVVISLNHTVFCFASWLKDNTYCKVRECCTDHYIPANFYNLRTDLERQLFGQHIVLQTVLAALQSHFDQQSHSKKALAMSFHGTAGTGKNFVADIIVKHMYELGMQSKFVHKFMGRLTFPKDSEVDLYRVELRNEIKAAVEACPRSIFIFDEVDKMPSGILESIAPMLDHHHAIHGVSYRQAVFIFLTNTGGMEVTYSLAAMMRRGQQREQVQLKEFENLCQLGAFHVIGGLQNSGVIESNLIDHYIPFLPLEQRHVKKCIESEYHRFKISPSPEDISAIMDELTMEPETGYFVSAGCKRITKKVESRISRKKYEKNEL